MRWFGSSGCLVDRDDEMKIGLVVYPWDVNEVVVC